MPSSPNTSGASAVLAYLAEPVTRLRGVGPRRAERLSQLGITTVATLLYHFPRDYEDRSRFTPIAEACEGETVTVEAELVSIRQVRLRGRGSLAEAELRDSSGTIRATWFGQGYLARSLQPGARGVFTGLVSARKGPSLRNPEFELFTGEDEQLHTGRLVPRYPLTDGVQQRLLRGLVDGALSGLPGPVPESLPPALARERRFPELTAALRQVHFPESLDDARRARERFAYAELLALQVALQRARRERQSEAGIAHTVDGPGLAALRAGLPFTLTPAQRAAVDDVLADLEAPRPMARLLQGDVGCGKTAVALHAIAAAADGDWQTALMAPTEVLAEQHAVTLRAALEPLGLEVALLTGGSAAARDTRTRTRAGDIPVVVGTHALLQDTTAFARLGLVVVDEQHRFGVVQRASLAGKGVWPDVLQMTATPIPRTLALTVYGGMDLTVIDALPPGRAPVQTEHVKPAELPRLFQRIHDEARLGRQCYYICPLVEESEKRDLASVCDLHADLSAGPLAGLRTALLHGRMPASEKAAVMAAFKAGAVDVLFSTTVVEVGVDCPNATLMVIEDAAQFGLTQLHQLRGRVGRCAVASRCCLLGKPRTREGRERIRVMCETTDGFRVAEADLALRGPGEFRGVRQSGLTDLRAADLVRDARLIDTARRDAEELLQRDPALEAPEHQRLAALARRFDAARR